MIVTAGSAGPSTAPGAREPRRDHELLRRFAVTRDAGLRAQLVDRYLPLARFAAGRYATGSEPFEDLLQVASIGLLKAIDRFDPVRGVAFSTYAMPTMTGELRRHFRDRSWTVRPPRDLQEHALAVERVVDTLSRELGRAPTVGEIGDRTQLSHEAVLEARQALGARHTATLPSSSGDDRAVPLEHLGTEDDGFADAEHRATLQRLQRVLTPRERAIIALRFQQDLTQAEIGERIGISQMHVSRLLRGALDKLHAAAASP